MQQLAFENVNSACKTAIRPYQTKANLTGYIILCADIGPLLTIMVKITAKSSKKSFICPFKYMVILNG